MDTDRRHRCSSASINHRDRLKSALEECLDHIHYLQDIFSLNVDSLNSVLKDQLMNRLLIPVYVFSLIRRDRFSRVKDPRIILDQSSALFLLAEVSARDRLRFCSFSLVRSFSSFATNR